MFDSDFSPRLIDAAYVNTLTDFILACRENKVEIKQVQFFQNGWQVTFSGCEHGDAICHDGSYGSPCYGAVLDESLHSNDWTKRGRWETIGFPWDGDDVSVHDSETLAKMIAAYQKGDNWEVYEK